jgi:hypothetical protein
MAADGSVTRSDGLRRATGRGRDEWFSLLDAWGAAGRPYREIADWLTGEQQVSDWWAQKVIVEYEQDRGLRPPGIRPDGTFSAGASKTIRVPIKRLFAAFADEELRERWLPDLSLKERTSRAGRSIRFDVGGGTRLATTFADLGKERSQVAVEEEHIPNAQLAEQSKAAWRERLSALKAMLEG